MMYRVANELAKKVNAKAIVTGEDLAQVASQTLSNLQTIDEASELPVFRPLIGFDKVETERIAKEIGTYDKSCIRVETCWAKPRKPTTKSGIQEVKAIEEKIEVEKLLIKSIETIREINFNNH
jgi:thiamine biosynthesis protein ThiI